LFHKLIVLFYVLAFSIYLVSIVWSGAQLSSMQDQFVELILNIQTQLFFEEIDTNLGLKESRIRQPLQQNPSSVRMMRHLKRLTKKLMVAAHPKILKIGINSNRLHGFVTAMSLTLLSVAVRLLYTK